MNITKEQAKRFLLMKQGLYGEYSLFGKDGICEYIKRAGCIQFDPIDVCGKNHQLVLNARIGDFSKDQLYKLLYEDRKLIDWWDKCQSICLTSDWAYFSHHRENAIADSRSSEQVDEVEAEIIAYIKENGPVCSADFDMKQKVSWGWGPTALSRAALETLYHRGVLTISHKKNTRKYYDLIENHIAPEYLNAKNPNTEKMQRLKWTIYRRIGAVGMLHNRTSSAFIGIHEYMAKLRNEIFHSIIDDGMVKKVVVEGINSPFYYQSTDEELMQAAIEGIQESQRLEFIAPLDNLMWDRRVIEEIFDFHYRWEIYTPIVKRIYGHYVLPILFGNNFIGRIEIKRDKEKGKFKIYNTWWEDKSYNTTKMRKLIREKLKGFNSALY